MCAYVIGIQPAMYVSPLLVAIALTKCRPAGSWPFTWNTTVALPNGSSATRRTTESVVSPLGSESSTVTPRGALAAEVTCSAYSRSSAVPTRAYSTSSSNRRLIAGTDTTGRRCSPRAGSAKRYTTGPSSYTNDTPAMRSAVRTWVSATRSSPTTGLAAVSPLVGIRNMSVPVWNPFSIHHGTLAHCDTSGSVMRPALSGTIVVGVPAGAVPYTFCIHTDAPSSTTSLLPWLYTVTVTGSVSCTASSSRGAVASTSTPAADSSARCARRSAVSSDSARSPSTPRHPAATPFRGHVSPARARASRPTTRASGATIGAGAARFSTRRTSATASGSALRATRASAGNAA